jgi:hypothetical protein
MVLIAFELARNAGSGQGCGNRPCKRFRSLININISTGDIPASITARQQRAMAPASSAPFWNIRLNTEPATGG